MCSGYYNLNIYQGASFQVQVNFQDALGNLQNLSGYSGNCGMKLHYGDTGVLAYLNVDFPTGQTGTINLSMPASGTAALPVTQALYELDLADPNGNIFTYLYGYANISPQVAPWP